MKQFKIKKDKQIAVFSAVILFFVLSCILVVNAFVNNSQADLAIIPDIRFVGEYKIADGEWQPYVEGEHISATKGDVQLRGELEIYVPEMNENLGKITQGSLMSLTLNHINLVYTHNGQIINITDTENSDVGEDSCGYICRVIEYVGEDGYFEATIRNNHRFGNETAIDELLSSMRLYAGDYSEKIALRSGQIDRLVAIIIIIAAFIVLGFAIFSYLFHNGGFRNYLFVGLLIFSAGIFFLFTSEGLYYWSDILIVNTMLKGLSAMAYTLFSFVLARDLYAEKVKTAANITTLLYGLFITVLVGVALFSRIYFYDMLGVWVTGVVVFSAVFIVFSLISLKEASRKQKVVLIFGIIGTSVLWIDIFAVYFGLWQTGLVSKIFFLMGFLVSAVVFLRIVPENIKAAKKAEELEKEKIILDAELTESRMSTLMSQIHPHFIYNTLGSIEQLCELDPPKAAKLVHDFSKYLRGNFGEIDKPRLIRVSKELEHTEYYLSIEKVRFPDIEFVTEMSCCDFSIPALTIQPIVENAVKHGILKREEGGTVNVKIYETDTSCFVSVSDNGVGFDVSELKETNRIGLRNIKSRLESMCGGILHIESIIGVGTKITVEIPKEAD